MTSSRQLQNLQHCIGGLRDILLVSIGVFFGMSEWTLGLIVAIIIFVTARLSSEIFYRILKKVEEEGGETKISCAYEQGE